MLGVKETHLRGCGVSESIRGNQCTVWEGMEGGVEWNGMDVRSKGKGRKGCALLISPKVWEELEHEWKGSRIEWIAGKVGLVEYTWVCVHMLVNMSNWKGREVMKKFGMFQMTEEN